MYNHQLDAFLQVADLGSFSKAAEAMYISAPAVIQQINLLESRVASSCSCAPTTVSHLPRQVNPSIRMPRPLFSYQKTCFKRLGFW